MHAIPMWGGCMSLSYMHSPVVGFGKLRNGRFL
jgi:hypothetical protein